MIEFKVKDDFKKISTAIKDIPFKEGVLLAAIERKNKIIFPRGTDTIEEKDIIVVVTSTGKIVDINDILE